MISEQLYEELGQLFMQLGVEIRTDLLEEEFNSKGGLCVVHGKNLLIINRNLSFKAKNKILIRALRSFNIEHIYIKPYVREVIESGIASDKG